MLRIIDYWSLFSSSSSPLLLSFSPFFFSFSFFFMVFLVVCLLELIVFMTKNIIVYMKLTSDLPNKWWTSFQFSYSLFLLPLFLFELQIQSHFCSQGLHNHGFNWTEFKIFEWKIVFAQNIYRQLFLPFLFVQYSPYIRHLEQSRDASKVYRNVWVCYIQILTIFFRELGHTWIGVIPRGVLNGPHTDINMTIFLLGHFSLSSFFLQTFLILFLSPPN